jgi:G3E family GTPase
MLENIPTHLIAGPLGAGKTTLLRHLLANRSDAERWAILVNEFGTVGIDAALMGSSPGVQIAEIPGGCLCCVNGVPFQVGLGRLLRRTRPERLFIEASGLGHPSALLQQLQAPPWDRVLQLESLIMVLDACALSAGKPLPVSQAEALGHADLLVLNKAGELDSAEQDAVRALLPSRPLLWCDQGRIPWPLDHRRPARPALAAAHPPPVLPDGPAPAGRLWHDPNQWECQRQHVEGWLSIGWLAHPSRRFDFARLVQWLQTLPFERAKGVIHTSDGWLRLNSLAATDLRWEQAQPSGSNRLELLFPGNADVDTLDRDLRAVSLTD